MGNHHPGRTATMNASWIPVPIPVRLRSQNSKARGRSLSPPLGALQGINLAVPAPWHLNPGPTITHLPPCMEANHKKKMSCCICLGGSNPKYGLRIQVRSTKSRSMSADREVRQAGGKKGTKTTPEGWEQGDVMAPSMFPQTV